MPVLVWVHGGKGRGQARREPSSTTHPARPSVPDSFTIHCDHFHCGLSSQGEPTLCIILDGVLGQYVAL